MSDTPVIVATFNAHAGMDGYGRRYDLIEACRLIGADVLILQEVFAPLNAASQAREIADALSLGLVELPLSQAWRTREELPGAGDGWEPTRPYRRARRALRVGSYVRRGDPTVAGYEEGTWGLALLARDAIAESRIIELGRLRRDFTSRAALSVTLGSGLRVVGTHLAHSTHGSPLHLRRLYSMLPSPGVPAVLGGDMNFWGPPLEAVLRGWRRSARGKTWPARRPRHQLDHLFVTRPVKVLGGGVVRAGDSDHLPLRAELSF
ncbi:MAG: endonuclease/exonuclease/phosphatase family protein [Acidimicrobiales bacterium]|jgi:endonuclease/exonuclease/phosphatase family metal-dependent hydrolase